MNNVIGATTGSGSLVSPGAVGGGMLLLLASYSGREDIERRAREEAAIEAEDILTQAEEANALDPLG
jgi:hypothetical protein